jgi:hypothetical protein
MATLLKLNKIKGLMSKENQPKGQRMHYFFYGEMSMLTKDQIKEVEKIIDADYKKTKAFLKEAKSA